MNDVDQYMARKARIAFINQMVPIFQAQSRDELCMTRPLWTDDPAALAHNLDNPAFFPYGFTVFDAPFGEVLSLIHPNFAWTLDVLYPPERTDRTIAEVLTNWCKEQRLTPPIFGLLVNCIAINDGMHRTAAAAFLRAERIKFYAKREHEQWFLKNVPGIQLLWRGAWP